MPIGTFLNNRPAEKLRGLMFLSLSDVAIIERRTVTSDGGGGGTYVWSPVTGGTVPCRVYPVSIRGNPRLVGERIDERTTHFCVLPPETDISPGQRISIANRGTYEVTLELKRTDSVSKVCEVFELD
jgi:hypothetical protein